MEATELLKKIRKIEIKSRGLSKQIFAGEYHSAFKGTGMTFSEVRDYAHGDDVRFIDWNVTARYNTPFIKTFEEEREMTVMLLLDVSLSNIIGSKGSTKRYLIAELAAVIAFSAISNNDKVGVILFSDQIEKFIPPKKGKKHIMMIIREILNHETLGKGTDLNLALVHLSNTIKKRCNAFLISDFIQERDYEKNLKLVGRKHDLIALWIKDRNEENIPKMGLVPFQDAESNSIEWIDSSSKKVQQKIHLLNLEKAAYLKNLFSQSKIDYTLIYTGESYTRNLITLFKRRA
ncbi:DUF58 domain-containing protein [Flavobacteriales bacterium]|jgi:uncharacterized protein (DUF58 family)|nr:DUF58 domain-containing protein [Flavobacteriales bacterium]